MDKKTNLSENRTFYLRRTKNVRRTFFACGNFDR